MDSDKDPWLWACNNLYHRTRKLKVPVLDTVIFAPSAKSKKTRPQRWIFMAKDGSISRKSEDKISYKKIRERFIKLSQKSETDAVCTVHMRDGSAHALDRASFETLIKGAERDGGLTHVAALQPFLASRGGSAPTLYRSDYSNSKKAKVWRVVAGEAVPSRVGNINQEVAALTKSIVKHLEATQGVRVASAAVDYVLDSRDCLWLAGLPRMQVSGESIPSISYEKKRRLLSTPETIESSDLTTTLPKISSCKGDFADLSHPASTAYTCLIICPRSRLREAGAQS